MWVKRERRAEWFVMIDKGRCVVVVCIDGRTKRVDEVNQKGRMFRFDRVYSTTRTHL